MNKWTLIPKKVGGAYKFANGMIMVFDTMGAQISELQGKYSKELYSRIKNRSTKNTIFKGFDEPLIWGHS